MKKPNQDDEPFFITEEIAAEMIAGGYEFELPPIPCTIRLRDVLERMTDAELACSRARSPTRSVNAAGASRVQPHDLVMVFFMALSLIVLANCCH
ncbi:hypothetical protein [Nitrosomonas eutropha]|uniref:Uncharacterized protein n=1 Tax=Nitrosomonas eutropha TaxID=916 RepID=A0ABX5M796_9PROT|nr:hypothetical protein C8R14_14519 [Nitrosomonas eutropha]